MKRIILGLLVCLTLTGCIIEYANEEPYPRYYYRFKDGNTYNIYPKYDSGECIGAVGVRLGEGGHDIITRMQYEKPMVIKCFDPHSCLEYKKCPKVKQ